MRELTITGRRGPAKSPNTILKNKISVQKLVDFLEFVSENHFHLLSGAGHGAGRKMDGGPGSSDGLLRERTCGSLPESPFSPFKFALSSCHRHGRSAGAGGFTLAPSGFTFEVLPHEGSLRALVGTTQMA
jgi:hypothetical protein